MFPHDLLVRVAWLAFGSLVVVALLSRVALWLLRKALPAGMAVPGGHVSVLILVIIASQFTLGPLNNVAYYLPWLALLGIVDVRRLRVVRWRIRHLIPLGLLIAVAGVALPYHFVRQNSTVPSGTAAGVGPDWQQFTNRTRNFDVMFPGAPVVKTTPPPPLDAQPDTTYYTGTDAQTGTIYCVMHIDYPPSIFAVSSPGDVMSGARDLLARSVHARVQSDRFILANNRAGREITTTAGQDGLRAHARLFVVGQRLYVVTAVYTATPEPPTAAGFLNSFRLR